MTEKSAIFIVGMHRSGTSAVSGAFQSLGYRHGNSVIPPADDNEFGFWESRRIINQNERMFTALGARWDSFPTHTQPFSTKTLDHTDWTVKTFLQEARRILKNEFEGSDKIVVKDPRICFFLPLWLEAAKAEGYDCKSLFVWRNPESVARSLYHRNEFPLETSFSLWLRYQYWALKYLPDETPYIRFSEFLNDPVTTMKTAGFDASDAQAAKLADGVQEKTPADRFPKGRRLPVMNRLLKWLEGRQKHSATSDELSETLNAIGRVLKVSDEIQGNLYSIVSPKKPKVVAVNGTRPVILHCHLFKNAGTSVDDILQTNFEGQWDEQEYDGNSFYSNVDLVRTHIALNTKIKAFSSHTANWQFDHGIPKTDVFPLIFLRHPVLRIESAYKFEKTQGADTLGARLAREKTFSEYVDARLVGETDMAFKNFQARRLAFFVGPTIFDLEGQAWEAFEKLDFIGCVERFDASLKSMEDYLKPSFPDFMTYSIRKNVTDKVPSDPVKKIEDIRAELGDALMQRLWDSNLIDISIHEALMERFDH